MAKPEEDTDPPELPEDMELSAKREDARERAMIAETVEEKPEI